MKKKGLVIAASVMLVLCLAVGGTLAWLMDETETIKNTFTVGNIEITLEESDDLDLKMVPGNTITKDPHVTVVDGSEDCWLFVKIEKNATYDTYLDEYVLADGWTVVPGETNVYYRTVLATDTDKDFEVLKDNQVTVLGTVEKTDMDNITNGTIDAPTLSFTAYAVQKANFATAELAWAEVE